MNGEGYLKWNDSREYKGEFKDDKRHGYGSFRWKDGKIYNGNWEEGK
jgi:hypothetical protein